MEPTSQNASGSDDEEDLESLRLAALQSLKKPTPTTQYGTVNSNLPKPNKRNVFGPSQGKHVKPFHGGQQRSRGGQFNRTRNSNLIAIPTVETEKPYSEVEKPNVTKNISKFNNSSDIPKLVLPQDRYCNTKPVPETKSTEVTTKFNRYDNSDNSESESEPEDGSDLSESESPSKLERSNSLEALMQELENEIQGEAKSKAEEKNKCKTKPKKSRKVKVDDYVNTKEEIKETVHEVEREKVDAEEVLVEDKTVINVEEGVAKVPVPKTVKSPNVSQPQNSGVRSPIFSTRSLDAHDRPKKNNGKYGRERHMPRQRPVDYCKVYPTPNIPFHPQPLPYPMPYNQVMPVNNYPLYDYMNNDSRSPPRKMYSPNRFDRPLSPLTLNTDIFSTIATAPLSPRSAAFVLHNREIIERRKKSPRRSYSRSPSPHFRRSTSPKYRRTISRSPRTSLSPRRLSPTGRQRFSPLRRISPGRLRASPVGKRFSPHNSSPKRISPIRRRNSPKRSPNRAVSPRRASPKSSIRNRLGMRSDLPMLEQERKSRKRSRSISLSLSPSPDRAVSNVQLKTELPQGTGEKSNLLEARRRKFESSGILATEGIIRLRPMSTEDGECTADDVSNDELTQDKPEPMDDAEDLLNEDVDEDDLLEGDDTYIDLNAKDLFSDEESNSENEGRFKSNSKLASSRNVSVLPFTKLVGGPNSSKNDPHPLNKKEHRRGRDRREINRDRNLPPRSRNIEERDRGVNDRDKALDRNKNMPGRIRGRTGDDRNHRKRSRTPLRNYNDKTDAERDSVAESKDKTEDGKSRHKTNKTTDSTLKDSLKHADTTSSKHRLNLKSDLKTESRKAASTTIENKKIEIKIRNPSKYELEGRNYNVLNENEIEEMEKRQRSVSRKVEVAGDSTRNSNKDDFDEPEPEIIIDNEDDDDLLNKNNGGDLRAQLSRKRAERQRIPLVEGVPSRIIQNALESAVFKKSKKSKSKKKSRDAAPKDTKIPIHLRLGLANNTDVFSDIPHKKLSRKRIKNRNLEQLSYFSKVYSL